MLARAKKARHKFLELPHEVQDEIIEKLDRRELTEESAEELARTHGCDISGRSISRYYEALRKERALHQRRETLSQLVAGLMPQDMDDNAEALTNLVISIGAEAILAANADLETLTKTTKSTSSAIFAVAELIRAQAAAKKVDIEMARQEKAAKQAGKPAPGGLSAEAADEIRRKILLGKN